MDLKIEPVEEVAEKKPRKSLLAYLGELKEELKKVTWTSKLELQFSTKAVIGAIFIFGLGIYFVDLLIKGVLDGFGVIVHFIFG
jgi:preprotein translocase subunit SecE